MTAENIITISGAMALISSILGLGWLTLEVLCGFIVLKYPRWDMAYAFGRAMTKGSTFVAGVSAIVFIMMVAGRT
jgi:hypothetical protein